MRHILLAIFTLFTGLGFASPAMASGDVGCYPQWKQGSTATCGSIAMISPGNDTRVNLILLLADRVPVREDFKYPETDWYEGQGRNFFRWSVLSQALYPTSREDNNFSNFYGSRCQTYGEATRVFAEQMNAARINKDEQQALIDARANIFAICADPDHGGAAHYYFSDEQKQLAQRVWTDPSSRVRSKKGKEFLLYLLGAKAFYGGDFETALNAFAKLTKSKNDWLKETAIYMIGRTEINRGQEAAFGRWGDFEGPEAVNTSALANAEKVLKAYIKNFPKGRYTGSATGFMRRIYWLSGKTEKLVGEYQKLVAHPQELHPGDFAKEADTKLFFAEEARPYINDPLLLAIINLEQMREVYGGEPELKLSDLEEQREAFTQNKELFDFLLASHAFYVEGNARAVLELIPDAARQKKFTYLQFSRQALRGLALAKLKDRNEEGFWRDMLSGAKQPYQRQLVELGIALNLEAKGHVNKIFAAGSPIEDRTIREILLQHSAGPGLLRRAARDKSRPSHERDVALFTLLYKQLASGNFSGYSQDIKLLPKNTSGDGYLHMLHATENIPLGLFNSNRTSDGFDCPKFPETASALAANKRNVRARLCLGDFIRLNDLDYFNNFSQKPKEGELGSSTSKFGASELGRQRIYQEVISDQRAGANEKAYALYRAVYCYARSGNNSCGGEAVAQSQRKAWFRKLKNSYPNSQWAKKLKYYW